MFEGKGPKLADYPDVLKDWDYNRNGDVNPLIIPFQSNKKYYWKCDKGHPSYFCSVQKRVVRNHGCPICSNHRIVSGINDFESHHPELMDEWMWKENNELGIIPSKISPSSGNKVWWKCRKCGNVWQAYINNRVKGSGCPYCSNIKALPGFNDLQTLRPELADEWDYEKNGDLTPNRIVAYSSKKVWWKCKKCGNSWRVSPCSREGCPFCSNKKVMQGFNDFATTCPEAAKEWDYERNGSKLPTQYTKGSETRVWWKCEKGHSWRTRIAERGRGYSCPYCSNQKVLVGYNDLFTTNPELKKEWDFDKNHTLTPYKIVAGSNKKAWWLCPTCGHSWKAIIATRTKRECSCPKCGAEKAVVGRLKNRAAKNGLFDKFPELEKEWDYEKNTIDVSLVSVSSNKYAWWKCEKGHSYKAIISARTREDSVGCPYCHGQKVLKGENDLQTLNPFLAKEWDYEKNAPLTPSDVFSHASKIVWWKCPECGHSWKAKIDNRANGRGCPNCSSSGTSFVEQALYYYLKGVYNDAISRYRYNNKYEIDIYIPSINTGIEYDGSYYHNSARVKAIESKKDKYCKDHGLRLIRLREKPLPPTESAINISCDYGNWANTEKTIKELLAFLGVDNCVKVSIKNDYNRIITSRRKLLKDNSIAVQYPELITEWDREKNLPLIPEYFSRGSNEKVWWICPNGHSYQASIASRCKGSGCSICFAERRKRGLHRKPKNEL